MPPVATTPVPPPTSGNIDQTVPAGTVTTKPSVPISATATFSSEVTVKVARIRALDVKAEGPGEISGPGLEITVRIVNGTAKPIDLGNTIVDLTDSEGNPTVPNMSGNEPITGTLAVGATASGSYQFKVPANLRNPVTIAVSYTTSAPVIVFSGKVG